MRGDGGIPGDSGLAQQTLKVHIFIFELLIQGAQRGVIASLCLLLLVAAIPWEDVVHRCSVIAASAATAVAGLYDHKRSDAFT